jgi:class 3 adenylate cyclase
MRALITALLSIGADPSDDEELRLRKLLVVAAASMFIPAGILWGAVYWAFGEPTAAAIPWMYVVLSTVSIGLFGVSRTYRWFALSQFALYLVLPFVLMWVLGGFVGGSAVAVWSLAAPLAALLLGHRRSAGLLLAGFAGLAVVSALVEPPTALGGNLPIGLVTAFFVLNLIGPAVVIYVLVAAFASGRETALTAARRIVRRYFSPDVVDAILSDPSRQELGGEVAELTVLFADLGGYTAYAETKPPDQVVALLNRYFSVAVPCIAAEGGTVIQLPGDAVMAVFGAPRHRLHHASHAARAALAVLDATDRIASEQETRPRFRIGLNSGPALVGNLGSDEYRNFTAIGDTVNLAQRLQALAEPGEIVVGPETAAMLDDRFRLAPLGPHLVKGKAAPVEPFRLVPA